jgi:uncharacterized repeat protein (TIGR01451 family)
LALGGLAAVTAWATPARAWPTGADLSLDRVSANLSQVRVGEKVRFTIEASNRGPQTSDLFVDGSLRPGLSLVKELCDFGVSPDTPSCAYSNIAPGHSATTIVVARVVASDRSHRTFTPCVSSSNPGADPNPANDCKSVRIEVVSP